MSLIQNDIWEEQQRELEKEGTSEERAERMKHFPNMPSPIEEKIIEESEKEPNPFDDPEHNELLDDKLRAEEQENLIN